jgi:hypothetical protein
VEVGLRTVDNETMLLEYWWLANRQDTPLGGAMEIRSTSMVYTYSETLLKSLLTMSRSTPAYRLARRQASLGDYAVQCRILSGEPRIRGGPDEYKTQIIGTVPSLQGTLTLTLAYKTRLHICPRRVNPTLPPPIPIISDDHYNPEKPLPSPQPRIQTPLLPSSDNPPALEQRSEDGNSLIHEWKKVKRPAFAADDDMKPLDLSSDIPFASLLHCPIPLCQDECENEKCKRNGTDKCNKDDASESKHNKENCGGYDRPENCKEAHNGKKCIQINCTKCHAGKYQHREEINKKIEVSKLDSSDTMDRDDFVLLELKAPFAGYEEDLGRFYRECQAAPALSMFDGVLGSSGGEGEGGYGGAEAMNSITEQLARFEANAEEFTEFVNSLQEVDS